jgi:hypothetical protein
MQLREPDGGTKRQEVLQHVVCFRDHDRDRDGLRLRTSVLRTAEEQDQALISRRRRRSSSQEGRTVAGADASPRRSRMAAKKSRRKYGRKASQKVEKAMRERKRGTLRTGSGKKVRSRRQAIAIGLAQARREGGKVPRKKTSSRSRSRGRKKSS